ncbi:unnamed protein product [Choristocarpus tenellus]
MVRTVPVGSLSLVKVGMNKIDSKKVKKSKGGSTLRTPHHTTFAQREKNRSSVTGIDISYSNPYYFNLSDTSDVLLHHTKLKLDLTICHM